MCAAMSGQLNGGDHAPRTLSARVADEKAKAQNAAARRKRFAMEKLRIFLFSDGGLFFEAHFGKSLTESRRCTSRTTDAGGASVKSCRSAVERDWRVTVGV